ncbi:YqiA/YcfP family alpha/beta fold hydrolase [Marinobacter sp.]|uniref:YqiA/YcfP family alpha/beta fold hydrolase n=1 Tax=Marinobacter sp. TaxID=50741 RepID=UPI0019E90D6E|nr:YqiA/YcfP family alpha/beta fold hydrolase [Marinobacter sp.]MBE0487033.1 alpha/beta hydrolase [Marinobacter sp.]
MSEPDVFVFLSHGLESGPGSTKIQALKSVAEAFAGVRAEAIDHRSTKDPAQRLEQMRSAMAAAGADPARSVLAGSSMGGWVCAQTSADTPVLGCFLLAPALALPKYPESRPCIRAQFTQIIHGWHDDVVPPMPVIELAQSQNLPILMLPDDHRLTLSVNRVANEFQAFLITAGLKTGNS